MEDRAAAYRDWHRTIGGRFLASDVDLIEWRALDGKLVPVGVFELTRVDSDQAVGFGYLQAIIDRIKERDWQWSMAKTVAEALGTEAYIVVFRKDLSEFWAFSDRELQGRWVHYRSMEVFAEFLRGLQ